MESEKDCIEYLKAIDRGETPKRRFVKRISTPGRKLSDKQIIYIFKEFEKGRTRQSIAIELKMSPSTIGRLISGQTKIGGKLSKRTKKVA
jgi:DNA-binding NarL/FixJ family response regulator